MQVIDKEKYFRHKIAGQLANIIGGAGTWMEETETTAAILIQVNLLSGLLGSYTAHKDGADIIKELHRLCMLLPDDGHKYTAILKRDAARILDNYININENIKQAYLTL